MNDLLEEWQKYQQKFLYLYPILTNPDCAESMPVEVKRFQTILQMQKYITATTKALQRNVLSICQKQDNLQERLVDSNKSMDFILKELTKNLEKKRQKFGRLYFYSNEDLIEIISSQRQPHKIQNQLKKVFENIEQLEFTKNNQFISAMVASDGEVIDLAQPISVHEKIMEDWLLELEQMMQKTVSSRLYLCLKGASSIQSDIMGWIQSNPSQSVLNAIYVLQTQEIEDYIQGLSQPRASVSKSEQLELPSPAKSSQESFFRDYQTKVSNLLNQLVEQILKETKRALKLVINSLIIQLVNCQDIAKKLESAGIKTPNDFEWIIHLRYALLNFAAPRLCRPATLPVPCRAAPLGRVSASARALS